MVGRFVSSLAVAAALFLIVPLLLVLPVGFTTASSLQFPPPGYSLRLMNALLADPAWGFAFRNSLIVGTGAALLATALAPWAGSALAAALGGYPALFVVLAAVAGCGAVLAIGSVPSRTASTQHRAAR